MTIEILIEMFAMVTMICLQIVAVVKKVFVNFLFYNEISGIFGDRGDSALHRITE